MYQEVKAKLRTKFPRLYLCVCLCMNTQRFEMELAEVAIKAENEVLREELFKSLGNIKKLYKKGKLILTRNTLERLLVYFNEERVLKFAGQD